MGIVREQIRADLFRYMGKTSAKAWLKAYWHIPGFRFLLVLRFLQNNGKFHPLYFFYRLLYIRMKYKYGFQIPYTSKIGKGFLIGHFGNIVINVKAVIGDNCNIAHGVSLGQTNRGAKAGCPVLGDRVWIGPNAILVGNITIGDDAMIAPLSYVNIDIPPNAVVMGNPAKIVAYTGSAGYVNNIVK